MSTPDAIDTAADSEKEEVASNFIRDIIDEDLSANRHETIVTRFPPEPNGYPHIGHAKSIGINFGIARDYQGQCNLRFDDTNPETEDIEYVNAIKRDVRWLGYEWGDHEYYASDYFEPLYEMAVQLIKDGKAYVDSSSDAEIREHRGSVTEPGVHSPYRERSIEENLDLFERMRAGEFSDGEHVLRAKIDMGSPNMKMRDPLMYRIRHAHHYRRGDTWCIYPMYDWAHGQSDALEGITHSLCTLEFDNNRELYDWFLDNLGFEKRPHQYEFARGNVDYTVMSKRKLLQLVNEEHVMGWDDPRMPTIAGMRRRGVTPEAIRAFWERVGVAKVNSRVDISLLEYSIRDDLNHRAPRVMAVLRPLNVTITNYPEGQEEWLDASYWPHDVPKEGSRTIPFSRTLYIERDDFMEEPSKRFYRLAPGREVRLRYGYFITCDEVIKNNAGEVTELRCTYDPDTKGGDSADGRRVKGTLHWVSAEHALPAEVRLVDRLFTVPDPDGGEEDFKMHLNPDSLVTLTHCYVEPSVADDDPDTRYQFERQGYFWRDPEDATEDHLIFNRIVALRDSWAKLKQPAPAEQLKKKDDVPKPPKTPKRERNPREELTMAQEARLLRYTKDQNLQLDDALILVDNLDVADFYEAALKAHNHPQAIANWVIHELLRELKDTTLDDLPFDGAALGRLVALIDDDTLSSRLAKDVFDEMLASGDDPQEIVERKDIAQVSDTSTLEPIIDKLLADFPDKIEAYRGGKTGLLGFFTGQVMRATKGQANPALVQEMLGQKLAG